MGSQNLLRTFINLGVSNARAEHLKCRAGCSIFGALQVTNWREIFSVDGNSSAP